mgnify:CR=1 FL=1
MNLFHEAKKVLDKDGKVNPLGPYGKQKLTGREVSTYFRRNKVKDAQIKKAVEVALDLGGAHSVASKEIKKFYGDKVLKSKEVQTALQYANEEIIYEGSFYGRDDLVKQFATPKNQRHLYIKLRKTDSKGTSGVSMKRKGNEDKIKKYKADGYKEVPMESVDENYRTLARKGMGAETRKSIKVGTVVDFYDNNGNKREGKIIKMGQIGDGYTLKDNKDGKVYKFKYHDRMKAKKLLAAGAPMPVEESLKESLSLLEKAYDANDVKKVQGLEKKLRNMLKEVDKVMRGSGLSAPAFSMVRGGITKGLTSIEKFYKIANKGVKESINEVTDKEINMAKKLSKDMEKVKKGYQQIAKSGDKTLKSVGFNPTYEAILKAQQKVLSLIGELNTMKMMSDRAASRQKDSKGRPIMNSFDAYRDMNNSEHCELIEGKVLKFTKVKDKSLEKHLKVVTKKVGAKLEKISGGFQVSDTDMRGFTAVVDYIFDKSIKKNMLDGGGMSDVNMVSENAIMSAPKQNMSKIKPMLTKLANKHKKVKVSFGTHSKGKFVDDNNINFNGDKKDIDMLMKDIQKNKSLMKMMESNLQEDEMINNQIANLQQRIQANRKRIGYINDVPAHQLGQGEINRRGRLKKSIADLETKIAGLRDKKKQMSQQDNNESFEDAKHQSRLSVMDTYKKIWDK